MLTQGGYEDLNPYSDKMAALQALIGRASLESKFAQLSAHQRPTVLRKPRRLLGGGSVQDEEIAHNSFGDTISADFSHIFNPTTRKDRAFIATHGYIPSRRRERYIAPIDRVIRASRPPSEVNSRLIEDTGAPSEVIGALRDSQELEHKVLLLVGSVGAGKSTFIDHLQEVALPADLISTTLWVRLNMNAAPVSANEIYGWLREEIAKGCIAGYPRG